MHVLYRVAIDSDILLDGARETATAVVEEMASIVTHERNTVETRNDVSRTNQSTRAVVENQSDTLSFTKLSKRAQQSNSTRSTVKVEQFKVRNK